MKFQRATNEISVLSVRRTGSSEDYSLTWDSCGLENFLIVIGNTDADVRLETDDSGYAQINDLLRDAESTLLSQDYVNFSNIGVSAYKISFSQLRQKGGFSANGKPGIYAVYGLAFSGNESVIYISENNSIRFTVDVSIEDVPVTALKGFFKKKETYSGYHRVSIKKAIPGLSGASLYYMVNQNNYKYPFPDEVVSKGGCFYVKCAENDNLRFGTTNNTGVRIR